MDTVLSDLESTTRAARPADTFHIVTTDAGYGVYRDCSRRATRGSASEAVVSLMAALNLAVLENTPYFAAHAGAVAAGDSVIAFPADSGDGKSTLVAACLRSGFDYLSDEALALDDTGRVVPYPKPVALSAWSRDRLGLHGEGEESLFPSSALDSRPHPGGEPVSRLVLIEREQADTSLEPLPRSAGVTALLSRSFNHYKDPERAFRLATETARHAEVWRLPYHDPLTAAGLLAVRFS